jgi:hypothetical protein
MSVDIPKTLDLVLRNIAIYEGKLNQTVPATDKAFYNVLSVVNALTETELVRMIISLAKQNLALTADRKGLILLGTEQGILPNPAEAAVLTGTIPATTGATLPATVNFIGLSNGVRYFPDASYTESGGVITVTVTAENVGAVGNLEVGAELEISSQISGIGSTLTVTVVDNIGADEQDTEDYRRDVLANQRALKGGGNPANYRSWSEEVTGVLNAFPYSKLPWNDGNYPGVPPERTAYIEATTDVDADGIPPQALLDEVRASITIDPETGLARQPLGITDDTLYVEPIFRTTIYVEIVGLVVPSAQEADIKTKLGIAVQEYLLAVRQFIVGLDFEDDQNNTITKVSFSDLVQGVIEDVGGSAEEVNFGTTAGVFTLTTKTLTEGETFKSGGITYA